MYSGWTQREDKLQGNEHKQNGTQNPRPGQNDDAADRNGVQQDEQEGKMKRAMQFNGNRKLHRSDGIV